MEISRKSILNGQFSFVDEKTVVCKHCDRHFKYHHSTSSLQYHLRNLHGFAAGVSPASNKGKTNSRPKTRWSPSDDVRQADQLIDWSKNDRITNSIAEWIVRSCHPISIAEDKGFEKIIQVASGDSAYTLPAYSTINARIDTLYERERKKLKQILQDVDYVALTVDYWTTIANKTYLGVTSHYVDNQWVYHSSMLGVYMIEEIDKKDFASTVAHHMYDVIDQWNLSSKITTVGADNGFNEINVIDETPFESLPCVAHMIQLSLEDGLSKVGMDNILTKCRKVVGHFNSNLTNSNELELELIRHQVSAEKLVQDMATRWSSTYNMLERTLKQKDAMISILSKQKHEVMVPSESEWAKLDTLKTTLEPCKLITEMLGGENYVPCSVTLPCLRYLLKRFLPTDGDPSFVDKFKTTFVTNIEKSLEKSNQEWLKISVALDPRFKKLKCLSKNERNDIWKIIEQKLNEFVFVKEDPDTYELEEKSSKRAKLDFNFSSDTDDEESFVLFLDARVALDRYKSEAEINQNDCPLQWWKINQASHPLIARLAKKYLSSPATTVPCERLFSVAEHISSQRRATLAPENANTIICLNSWLSE